MTLLTRVVLTWSSRLRVEHLGVVGPGRSATAKSSACQHPVRPKNVTTRLSREDPASRFNSTLLGLPGLIHALGSAVAERHSLPRLIALWEFPCIAQTRCGRPGALDN